MQAPSWPASVACACTAVAPSRRETVPSSGDELDGLLHGELAVLLRLLVVEGQASALQRADGAQLRRLHAVRVGHRGDLRQQVAAVAAAAPRRGARARTPVNP